MPDVRKIVVITCKSDPDYIRARTLRQALRTFDDLEVLVIKNKRRNVLRYLEVLAGIIKTRITKQPDAYLLTFRGYELIPLLQILAWPKPIIFDEFINLYEWVVEEHQKVRRGGLPARLLGTWWSFILKHCDVILTDTHAHALHSAIVSNIPISKYVAVPVGTDETLFMANARAKPKKPFIVFYYSNMLPLHGLEYVLQAAELLKDKPEILLQLAGSKDGVEAKVQQAQKNGARIHYETWVPFAQLPGRMRSADLFLGGPFGNTVQSQLVVTGKTYQSLACGVPTVVGASEASDIFTDKLDSLVVPQGNAQELARVIAWAYEHPDKLTAIGHNGRQLFEKHFSTRAVAQRLAPVLQRLQEDDG